MKKPLTKAVWRTKYKGFPLSFYVVGGVSVHFICAVCVCVGGEGGFSCDWTKGIQGEAMQGMHVMSCCYCAVHT